MRLSIWFVCVSAVLASMATAQDPSTIKVSFKTRVVSLPEALREASKDSPLKLEAGPTVASDTVMIRVQDVTLKDLMDRISKVTAGEWKLNGTTYTLTRGDVITRAQARQDAATIAANLRKQIVTVSTNLAKAPKYDVAFLKSKMKEETEPMLPTVVRGMFGGTYEDLPLSPGQRLMVRIISQMNMESLALLNEGRTMTFAVNPTRMQRPAPAQTMGFLNLLRTEQAVWKQYQEELAKSRPARPAQSGPPLNLPDGVDIEEFEEGPAVPEILGPVGRVLIKVSKNGWMDGGISFLLRAYDQKGASTFEESYYLSSDIEEESAEGDAAVQREAPDGEGIGAPDLSEINLSTESKQLVKIIGSFMNENGESPALPAELKAALSSPTTFDPINLLVGDFLSSVADKEKLNVVALLPDEYINIIQSVFGGSKITMDQAKAMVMKNNVTDVAKADNWLEIKPKFPSIARQKKLNRASMQSLIYMHQTRGTVSLDDFAAFAVKNANPSQATMFQIYSFLVCPSVMRFAMGSINYDILQIYGLMNPQQRQQLNLNKQIAFQAMSPTQRQILEAYVFSTGMQLSVITDQKQAEEPDEFMAEGMMFARGFYGSSTLQSEPTETLPNGLPFDGYVEVQFSNREVFKFDSDNPMLAAMSNGGAMPLDTLASFLAMQEMPEGNQFFGRMPKIERVMVGQQANQTWSFWFAPKIRTTAVLSDVNYPKDSKGMKISELPKEIQDRIKAKVEEIKKAMENGGMPDGTQPPRPPR